MKRTALFCAIAALPLLALADDATVVVTGKDTSPAGTDLVNESRIRARAAATSDTASLLRDVPGVSLYGAGGASSLPAIHGMADDRLRIKVDAMDLVASCPNHMNPALSYLDPSNVAKLTVYAGISPVSLGGDSIGGVIIAQTPAPEFARMGGRLAKGELGAFHRSNGNAYGANLSAKFATESVSVDFAASQAKADNYVAGGNFRTRTDTGRPGHEVALDEVGSTAYDTRNGTLGLAFRSGMHQFEVKLGYQDVPEQLFPNQRMDMLKNTQHRVNLSYAGGYARGDLELRAYRETVDHYMNFGPDKQLGYGTAANGMPMYTEGETTGASAAARIHLMGGGQVRTGVEVQRYRLDDWWPASGTGMMAPGTFFNIRDGERDRTAVYAEWEAPLRARLSTQVGARYEHVSMDAGNVAGYAPTNMMGSNQARDAGAFNAREHARSDNNLDLAALVRYLATDQLETTVGVARKVRSPNLYERYTWSTWTMAAVMNNFVGDGNGYVGNLDLKPEVAHTLSATFDWHDAKRGWEIKATPYVTQVSDYVDAVQWNNVTNAVRTPQIANQFTVLKFVNQSARLYGVDLSGHGPLARTAWGTFAWRGVASLTRGTNRDTGGDLYNIMPANVRLIVSHTLGGWEGSAEWHAVARKSHVSDVRNEIVTAGHSVLNLHGSYAWSRFRVDLGVDNVLDKAYQLPLGGAYVGQGSTMAITAANMPWGIAMPGPGRSYYVGFSAGF